MITEDYCSFEIAELLKEKGFDGECDYWYDEYGGRCCSPSVISVECWCPSQSLALKWLREVHNIHIEIYRTACGYLYIISNIPYGTDLYNPKYGGDDENSGQWTTYEKAVEAAILYVLKNLI